MKQVIRIFLMTTIITAFATGQSFAAEQWWTYLASYDEGPGSIRVDLGLKKQAPLPDYQFVVVTGTTYKSNGNQGLPEVDDLDRLNDLNKKVITTIGSKSPFVYAGTFSQNFEQLHYVYVKDIVGIEDALASLYKEACPRCKIYTKIRQDSTWSAYLEFLYPSQATRDHYGVPINGATSTFVQAVLPDRFQLAGTQSLFERIQLTPGFDLTKPAMFGYFFISKFSKRLASVREMLEAEGYTFVETHLDKTGRTWLQMAKSEVHSAESMVQKNGRLQSIANKFENVEYDGWDVTRNAQ